MYNNQWLVISLLFILLILTYHLGFKFGKNYKKGDHEKRTSRVSNIQAGLMGLLGVMLAFSFSLSSSRFEQRRQLVIQESMNIGTAYFRVGLLNDTLKTDLRNLLDIYLDERINFYKSGNSVSDMERIQKNAEKLQVQIWAKTASIGKKAPNLNTNITILALNSMIDITSNISSSFQTQVPLSILILLSFISVCTVLIFGYSDGLSNERNLNFMVILNIVLCSILLIIMDLDSPTEGFLQADIYSLIQLRDEIKLYTGR